jgi:hypothetical protein
MVTTTQVLTDDVFAAFLKCPYFYCFAYKFSWFFSRGMILRERWW